MIAKTNSKSVKVKVDIRPGKATLAQRASYGRFWQQLAARVRAAAAVG